MTTASKRVLGYVVLALASYAIAAALGGMGPAAMVFVTGGVLFEGFLWMEARRRWRRRHYPSEP
jgi:NhaP-type Na+/H+ or K+/H+ antiporter